MSRSKGKRYTGRRINFKKVFALLIAIAVIVMFIIGINKLLTNSGSKKQEKNVATRYFVVYSNNKWGVINSKGETVINPSYDETIIIPDNSKPVFICTYDVDYTNQTYKTKVINEKENEIFKDYELIEAIENYDNNNLWYEKDVLKVKKDEKYGLIDLSGKELLKCEYDSITSLKGTTNSLVVTIDGKKGLVDNIGGIVINPEYKNIKAISEKYENGYIVQSLDGKYGVIGANKVVLLETIYDDIKQVYGNGKYVVCESGKWEIVNTDGDIYLNNKFDSVKSIDGDNIVIKKDNKYGVISIDGEKILDTKYQDITYAFGDNYIVKLNNKYGILNLSGDKKIDYIYKSLVYRKDENFIEGSKNSFASDLIDTEFNVKLTGIISEINTTDGYMKVRVDGQYKYYNFKFEEKTNIDILKTNTLFLSKKDEKYGYVNKEGVVVVDYIYDDAKEQNEFGYASIKKDGLWGCINTKGEVIISPAYKLENNLLIEFIGKWHRGEDLNLNYYTDK